MELSQIIATKKEEIINSLNAEEKAQGELIFYSEKCHLLYQAANRFDFMIQLNDSTGKANEIVACELEIEDEKIIPRMKGVFDGWERFTYASLLKLEQELQSLDHKMNEEHKKYSRVGMKRRVLAERAQKARNASYRIKWANNIYGDHILTNENGVKYTVFLRDFEKEIGYSNSLDFKYNKLGTSKHIMYAFNALKTNDSLYKRLKKTSSFLEIYLDQLNKGKISWFFKGKLQADEEVLIAKYFKDNVYKEKYECTQLLAFLEEIKTLERVIIRPEVEEKIKLAFEEKLLKDIEQSHSIDYSELKITPYDYQKKGIQFATFKKGAIIADEMGLGKTLQAIGAAIAKKKIFDFKKVLVICPASIKEQWKKEIEKFSYEKALVIEGKPDERMLQYFDKEHYFLIANYESVLRDQVTINNAGIDFLILDEAQRAKNYETKTATSLKRLKSKHTLIITGTPIENKLIDLYSIIGILDQHFLGPLWEFSYQHCLFDPEKINKINGYYDLQKLKTKLAELLIRREKREIIKELPNLRQIDIAIGATPLQAEYHASYKNGVARIVHKKFLTPYDMNLLRQLLTCMRMVCDSTHLIDDKTNDSPKLEELRYILLEKLNLQKVNGKVIIFSEWIKMHKLIGVLLRELNIGFVELNGKVPVKLRGKLIEKFEHDDSCKIFLATEAGGVGLNLQMADTVINFELPWNPAKKNQRIGRIDRLGQKHDNLTVFNFITKGSIEEKIADGLILKQSLFEGVLVESNDIDFVDFSNKGKSQFIQDLKDLISGDTMTLDVDDATEFEEQKKLEDEKADIEDAIDLSEEEDEETNSEEKVKEKGVEKQTDTKKSETTKDLEKVMNDGMQFLSGLFKMSTGKDLVGENQSITVDEETGEVTIKFNMPKQ